MKDSISINKSKTLRNHKKNKTMAIGSVTVQSSKKEMLVCTMRLKPMRAPAKLCRHERTLWMMPSSAHSSNPSTSPCRPAATAVASNDCRKLMCWPAVATLHPSLQVT